MKAALLLSNCKSSLSTIMDKMWGGPCNETVQTAGQTDGYMPTRKEYQLLPSCFKRVYLSHKFDCSCLKAANAPLK